MYTPYSRFFFPSVLYIVHSPLHSSTLSTNHFTLYICIYYIYPELALMKLITLIIGR